MIEASRPSHDPAVYVAQRIVDPTTTCEPGERLPCARCAAEVWVDSEHYRPLKLRQHALRVLCIECAAALAELQARGRSSP